MKVQRWCALLWFLTAVLVLPPRTDAQIVPMSSDRRPAAVSDERLPVPSAPRLPAIAWPTLKVPSVRIGQERRLPVYDDAGEIIPFQEIEARVDPSGSTGAWWGALVGSSVGSGIGALLGRCGGEEGGYRYYCSPRDEALRNRLPVGLGITFAILGAWIGYSTDRTTFDEALSQIRYERRVGR